jgi:membrane-associated phospholipid phosphatase
MPSGHTEIHWVFLSYLALMWWKHPDIMNKSKQFNTTMTYLVVLMTALVMWQRWVTERHSVQQITWGAITGSVIGYIAFKYLS